MALARAFFFVYRLLAPAECSSRPSHPLAPVSRFPTLVPRFVERSPSTRGGRPCGEDSDCRKRAPATQRVLGRLEKTIVFNPILIFSSPTRTRWCFSERPSHSEQMNMGYALLTM